MVDPWPGQSNVDGVSGRVMVRSEIVLSVRIVLYNKVHDGTSLHRTGKKRLKPRNFKKRILRRSTLRRMSFPENLRTGLEAFPILKSTPSCRRQ